MKKLFLATSLIAALTIRCFSQSPYYQSGYWHYFPAQHGTIYMGGESSQWAHIYTDLSKFIFNKPVYPGGGFLSSYQYEDLQLQTWGTTRLFIENDNGHVGIGTSSPAGLLEIKGPYNGISSQVIINSTASNAELRFSHNDVTKGYVWYNANTNHMAFGRGSAGTSMFVDAGGNVGIGMIPNYKLDVNGTIHTKEVLVDLNFPAPDYVFADDYALQSLEEVEEYIQENKHLPGVPSAAEMSEQGVKLLEMNMKLLEKVEELTLHLIEHQNQIELLQQEITKLKSERK